MNNLRNLHVLVLGLGASGLAMVRWCAQHGAVVTVVDTREAPPQLATLCAELPTVAFVHSDFNATLVEGTSIRAVFKSPGLSPAETVGVMDAATGLGLWVGGELSLFAQALKDLAASPVPRLHAHYAPKVLAITGTNGKSTTTPNRVMTNSVSQSPNFRVDFWIIKSPKPQQSMATNESPIPIATVVIIWF